MHVLHLLLLLLLSVEEPYLNNKINKHENLHVYTHFFLACALSGYIFVNPFTCVTDCYQHKQCIIMETETETNMEICRY